MGLQMSGCKKGDLCEYLHPKAPNGKPTSYACEDFLFSKNGCAMGRDCPYLHPDGHNLKVCEQYLTREGCRRADRCTLLHPRLSSHAAARPPCEFFFSGRGKRPRELGLLRIAVSLVPWCTLCSC